MLVALSGCSDEIQSLNYLESPISWAVRVSKKLDYIAEIPEKVIHQQQSWMNGNSFVMRDLLLHFLFSTFTCNDLNFFLLNNFYKYFSYMGYWKAI